MVVMMKLVVKILIQIECTNDEFRCGNGFCIPNNFFNDDVYNPDCIDRSDEKDT